MAGKSLILLIIGAAFLAAVAPAAVAPAADPPADAPKQRLICRGSTASLGSHIRTPQRCRTAEQWREEDEARGRVPLSLQVTQGQNDGHAASAPH